MPDETLERSLYYSLTRVCPRSGGDNNISPLDFASPVKFDNYYYKSIMEGRGLLNSDEILLTGNEPFVANQIKSYAEDQALFFDQFVKSMVKMGNINPLTGYNGEVRKNCRRVNGAF
jgi:peroxidase